MTRRIAVVLLMLVGMTSTLAAQDVRYTNAAVRMRADAAANSKVVETVPVGARVEIIACAVAWCWVDYEKRTGYIAEEYLSAASKKPASSASGYVNALGAFVPSPKASASGPPRGAKAKCRDGTYSFSKSRSGTCANHGGVAKWL